ncbi:MAG: hypothetical protein ACN6PY_06935 [Paraburkholderia nemoris]
MARVFVSIGEVERSRGASPSAPSRHPIAAGTSGRDRDICYRDQANNERQCDNLPAATMAVCLEKSLADGGSDRVRRRRAKNDSFVDNARLAMQHNHRSRSDHLVGQIAHD